MHDVKSFAPEIRDMRICKYCGVKYELVFSDGGPAYAGSEYQHCEADPGEFLLGPVVGLNEEKNGEWVSVF